MMSLYLGSVRLPAHIFPHFNIKLVTFPRNICLGTFLDRCKTLKSKKELLDSVQKLLNLPLKSYPELDQTEQDLSYLRALYENYQQFIAFDKRYITGIYTWGSVV